MLVWTILGALGLGLIVAGVGVVGWIVAGTPGGAAGSLIAAGVALLWSALDALRPEDS